MLNKNEPVPPGALEEPPEWMNEASWRYALGHATPGLVRRLDRGLLTIWVMAEDAHRRAAIQLNRGSETMLVLVPGVPLPQPSWYLSIMNKQALIMLKAASERGFSPASRARVYAKGEGDVPAEAPVAGPRMLRQFLASAPPPVVN